MILAPALTLSAGSGAAIVRPTFSRDFAGEKTLNNGTGPAITFTRASNATFFNASGVLQTAANDAPRFDHSGGSSLGLLIEEARTNLLLRSAEFNNASWTKANATITANSATSPDGGSNADTLVEDSNSAAHAASQTVTYAASTPYSFSVFAKQLNRSWIFLQLATTPFGAVTRAWFNLANGTVGTQNNGTGTITSVGDGWYRCTLFATSTVGGSGVSAMHITTGDAVATHTGDNTSGIFIWGAQLEAGAFPTSYIPTTTAAATRSADNAVVTPISSFYNQAEGTLFAEGTSNHLTNSLAALVSIDDTTANERIQIRRGTQSNLLNIVVADGGSPQASIDTATSSWASATEIKRIALALKADDLAVSMNGATALTDTSATLPTVTRMVIGFGPNSQYVSGHIRKLAYWPKRLTNTLLQQLTT